MSVSGLHMYLHICEYDYAYTYRQNTGSGDNVRMVKGIRLSLYPCLIVPVCLCVCVCVHMYVYKVFSHYENHILQY